MNWLARIRIAFALVFAGAILALAFPLAVFAEEGNGAVETAQSQETDLLIWTEPGPEGDRVFFTDMAQRPISGEWRIEGQNYVLADDGTIFAGGGPLGTKGRLYVPVLGVDVPVNVSNNDNAQYYTDLEDSAAYVRYSLSKYYIADHNNQAFAGLVQTQVGDQAFLFTEGGIEAFECYSTMYGHNIEWGLTDDEDNDIINRMPLDGFVAYTCLDNWWNVHITYWKRTWIADSTDVGQTAPLERKDARDVPMEPIDSPMELENRIGVPLCPDAVQGDGKAAWTPLPLQEQVGFFGLNLWHTNAQGLEVSVEDLSVWRLRPDLEQFDALLKERIQSR
ncbi:MAG: hypothetical protein IJ131_06360 [Eggerthellaceae bacterium]|nr:hypothetical protein [Eggerthellaceae bacterium]